jgi:glycosyltransferase involved in cell wall biosynthesis
MRFSIVIPTRERCETLVHALRTCTAQDYDDLDIIVSDNFSRDATRTIVESCNDPRVRYVNPGRRLSMTENFEYALSFVRDGFVMFIGDDDGVLPGGVRYAAKLAETYKPKAIACKPAIYLWPGVADSPGGRLSVAGTEQRVEIRSTRAEVARAIRFESHYVLELPCLYGGFVHTDIIKNARLDGRFFRSIIPDAYAAFAVGLSMDSYAYSFRPFVIGGTSRRSNGISQMAHGSDTFEAESFEKENTLPFHPAFVYCRSYPVFAGECFTQAAEAFPDRAKGFELDFERMLKLALFEMNERNREEVTAAVRKMAAMRAIPESALKPERYMGSFWQRSHDFLLPALKNPSRIVAIEDARRFEVRNIHEASILAGAIIALDEGAGLQRALPHLTRLAMNRLKSMALRT